MNNSTFKLGLVAISLGATVAANALTLSVSSVGTFTVSSNVGTFTESVIYQSTSPVAGPFTSAVYTLDANTFTGTAVYMNAADTQELDLNIVWSTGFSQTAPFTADSGTWTYTGGKGDYVAASGGGSITTNFSNDDKSSLGTLKGALTPVPEPASFAVMGIGILGLVARRRRK